MCVLSHAYEAPCHAALMSYPPSTSPPFLGLRVPLCTPSLGNALSHATALGFGWELPLVSSCCSPAHT